MDSRWADQPAITATVTFGAAPPQPPREPPHPEQLRVVWRVDRRQQSKIQHAIYKHHADHCLKFRVFLGNETDDNLLHSEVARFDFAPLEEKATNLREVLITTGWTDSHTTQPMPATTIDDALRRVREQYDGIIEVIRSCLAGDELLSGSILLYAAIDGMAWLPAKTHQVSTVPGESRAAVQIHC
jgi:hypothetical protein